MAGADGALLDTLLELFRKAHILQAAQYSQVASTALLYWDYALTLPQEIEFFWNGRFSWPALLFFLNRYVPIVSQTFNTTAQLHPVGSDAFCKFWLAGLYTWSGALEILVAQCILLARLNAVYGNKQSFFLATSAFLALTTSAYCSVFIYNVVRMRVTAHPYPGVNMCIAVNGTGPLYLIWIPVLLFEAVAFGLLMHKVVGQMRRDQRVRFSRKTLLHVIMRDNLVYFAIILVLYLAEGILWAQHDIPERELLDGPSIAIISILGNRMLLNIRRRNRDAARPELVGTLTAAADAMLGDTSQEVHVPMDPLRPGCGTPSTVATERSMPWHIPTFLSYEEHERYTSEDEDSPYEERYRLRER